MRIAVLFYGRIDKARETYENIINAIEKSKESHFYMGYSLIKQ